MADTRFGNFQQLAQGKKPMTAKEAFIMLNELGLLAQEFVPGATSVRKLIEGKPMEALYELQDWIPGNAAWQNFINGREQDWVRNGLDAMSIANPLTKGVSKVMRAVEKVPKGGKGGFLNVLPVKNEQGRNYLTKATNPEEIKILNDGVDIAKDKKIITAEDAEKLKNNFNSTYNHDVHKQKLIDAGLLNPNNKNRSSLKLISKDDIKNKSFDDYDKAKELGEKYRVKIKDKGTSLEGDDYFTLYSDNTPMLYSEDLTDANIGRHVLSDYDSKIENVNKEARELLPDGNNQIKQIFGKGQNKSYNTYKSVIEPEMFKDLMILNNNEASRNSVNAGKALSDNLENKITPMDFYKIMLGL